MGPWRHLLVPYALTLVVAVSVGCSRAAVKAPKFSPAVAARQALAEFDADKDGSLDANELAKCPGLLAAKSAIDQDKDGRLSESEIVARLRAYQGSHDVVKLFPCRVLLDEQPLAKATVTLVPEKFLGPTFKSCTGVTMEGGDALVAAEDVRAKGFSGVYCGLYRVQISCKDAAGKEVLAAHYNTETTLGLEVPADSEPGKGIVFRLSSRSSSH